MNARWLAVIAPVVLAAATGGCARVPAARSQLPEAATPDLGTATADQARCSVRRSADRPLVVEWPAADRAALEARAQQGLVAVRYEGCTMEVLTHCEVDGRYEFLALSPKQERVAIRSTDELYARLPVGAAGLEGKLEHGGELVVDMSIVGRQQADRHVVSYDELTGRCDGVTHVLTGLTVGAFTLHALASSEAGAQVEVAGAGAGAVHERSRELLTRDGDPRACERPRAGMAGLATTMGPGPGAPSDEAAAGLDPGSTPAQTATTPPPGCGALLRVEAVPLAGEAPPRPAVVAPEDRELALRDERRQARRSAAWRGVAIGSGVLSAASLGGIVGGSVFLFQSGAQPVWEEPSADDLRRKRIGTGMLVSSSIGFVGFGALALGASAAARRTSWQHLSWVTPSVSPTGAGLWVRGRF